jgi:hypothetical protein
MSLKIWDCGGMKPAIAFVEARPATSNAEIKNNFKPMDFMIGVVANQSLRRKHGSVKRKRQLFG